MPTLILWVLYRKRSTKSTPYFYYFRKKRRKKGFSALTTEKRSFLIHAVRDIVEVVADTLEVGDEVDEHVVVF